MSSTRKSTFGSAKRVLATAASAAMIFALLPAGLAVADTDDVCPPPDGAETFPDVSTGVHADNIECLAGYDIAQGYPDGEYKPELDITRAQMATFIANLIETALGTTLAEGDDAFTDDENSVHESNINKLANAGVVSGRAPGIYGPSLSVDRAPMATFIANALDYIDDQDVNNSYPPASTTDHFPDDDASTHEDNINRLADQGIVAGYPDGEYKPGVNVFRGQMATFVMEAAEEAHDDLGQWAPLTDEEPAAGLAVTPTDDAVNNASTSTSTNEGARTYTVSGLDDSKAYDIMLVNKDAVQEDADPVTFDDGDQDNHADQGTVSPAVIETVNGASAGTSATKVSDTTPINGQITFTVDSTGFAEVIPVVWVDSVGTDDDQLDLVVPTTSNANPKEAAEVFGLGGMKTWIPAEAANGATLEDKAVQFVDKDANFFVADDKRFNYDCVDVFRYNDDASADVESGDQVITCEQWETALNLGDLVDTITAYSRTFQNSFGLEEDTPGTPTNLTAANIGDLDNGNDDHDVQFTWDAPNPPNGLIDTYSVTILDDNTATAACDGSSVRTETSSSTSVTANDLANDSYCATVKAWSETGDDGSASAPAFFTVQKGDADTTAPLINDLQVETDSGTAAVIDSGDVIYFDHSETMTIDTTASRFRFTDPDGEQFEVECDTNATCSLATYTPSGGSAITNGRVIVTLNGAPTKVGGPTPASSPGVAQVPGEVYAITTDWDDTAGNDVDLTNSPDTTIDNEF